jgi:threonine dehydrogenase-like Zn-dependent dehydrogenase
VCTRDVTVIGIGGERAEDYPAALAMMASQMATIPLERVVSHRSALGEAGAAVELSQTADAMKVVIEPSRG